MDISDYTQFPLEEDTIPLSLILSTTLKKSTMKPKELSDFKINKLHPYRGVVYE